MNISDLVTEGTGKKLTQYILKKEMERVVDQEFIDYLKKVMTPEFFTNWFYPSLSVFKNERPYDLCKEGRADKVKAIL